MILPSKGGTIWRDQSVVFTCNRCIPSGYIAMKIYINGDVEKGNSFLTTNTVSQTFEVQFPMTQYSTPYNSSQPTDNNILVVQYNCTATRYSSRVHGVLNKTVRVCIPRVCTGVPGRTLQL
jgi:hypothetical protein